MQVHHYCHNPPFRDLHLVKSVLENIEAVQCLNVYGNKNIKIARELLKLINKTSNFCGRFFMFSSFLSFDLLLSSSNLLKDRIALFPVSGINNTNVLVDSLGIIRSSEKLFHSIGGGVFFKVRDILSIFKNELFELDQSYIDRLYLLYETDFFLALRQLFTFHQLFFDLDTVFDLNLFFDEKLVLACLCSKYFQPESSMAFNVFGDNIRIIVKNAAKRVLIKILKTSLQNYETCGGVRYAYLKMLQLLEICKGATFLHFRPEALLSQEEKNIFSENVLIPFIFQCQSCPNTPTCGRRIISATSSSDLLSRCIHNLSNEGCSFKCAFEEVLSDVFESRYNLTNPTLVESFENYQNLVVEIKNEFFLGILSLQTIACKNLSNESRFLYSINLFKSKINSTSKINSSEPYDGFCDRHQYSLFVEDASFINKEAFNLKNKCLFKKFFNSVPLDISFVPVSVQRLYAFVEYINANCHSSFFLKIELEDFCKKTCDLLKKEDLSEEDIELACWMVTSMIFHIFPGMFDEMEFIFQRLLFILLPMKNLKITTIANTEESLHLDQFEYEPVRVEAGVCNLVLPNELNV